MRGCIGVSCVSGKNIPELKNMIKDIVSDIAAQQLPTSYLQSKNGGWVGGVGEKVKVVDKIDCVNEENILV